jgi:RNA polymerase sigma-70 factor (ECF subfamily)
VTEVTARLDPPRADAPTDAALVREVLAGERNAFSELVRRHQDSLYRYTCSMGVAPDAAQDLVQDAFVRAYVRLGQCRDVNRFRSWLLGILRNRVLDYGRDLREQTTRLEKVPEAGLAAAPPQHELRYALDSALERLPALLREAFLLRHHQGYGYEEIAAITGSRVSAVKMRVHRAREQLQEALSGLRM